MKRKYHYEWAAYTDNITFGRVFIARGRDYKHVAMQAVNSRKGAYTIQRERVYDN